MVDVREADEYSHEKIISNLGRNASKLNGFVCKSTIQFYIITLVWKALSIRIVVATPRPI